LPLWPRGTSDEKATRARSPVAYSLFNEASEDLNAAPGETALMLLILRDLDRLRAFVRDWLTARWVMPSQHSAFVLQPIYQLLIPPRLVE
jgi:hypothetical protein